MQQYSIRSLLVIWCSLLCAAFLQVMPVPTFLDAFRPNWVLLVALYWAIAMPYRFNLGSAWLAGIMLDLIWGTMLGINALAFVFAITPVVIHFQKIRSFSIGHQALVMTGVSLLYQLLSYLFELWLNDVIMPSGYYFSSLITIVAWPWLFLVLRKARRHWRIN